MRRRARSRASEGSLDVTEKIVNTQAVGTIDLRRIGQRKEGHAEEVGTRIQRQKLGTEEVAAEAEAADDNSEKQIRRMTTQKTTTTTITAHATRRRAGNAK